ncbi:type IV pilin protein [Halopseudomonas salegens]|uniref:Type IV pilus assembly protein PilE n=1 Tax=Halopseudomonas salegens TaxID=1434072 RepID=A0A1H2GLZ1_9GAMM|nr:type IV pilin protein [Halopseudomonas salegens]SDU20418.1 type IV pilus assembly protein PilE [Halopseudomonas salegens]
MIRWQQSGFTLIEVMVVVAIVGILAAVAYPAYTEQVKKTRRAEVSSVLLENAHMLERHYTRNGSYEGGQVHGLMTQSPTSGSAVYSITVTRTEDTYLLEAVAVIGGVMEGDTCATYSLDQLGQRTPVNTRCWRR